MQAANLPARIDIDVRRRAGAYVASSESLPLLKVQGATIEEAAKAWTNAAGRLKITQGRSIVVSYTLKSKRSTSPRLRTEPVERFEPEERDLDKDLHWDAAKEAQLRQWIARPPVSIPASGKRGAAMAGLAESRVPSNAELVALLRSPG